MTQKAEVVWKSLNGIVCAYKPADTSCGYVKNKIISNLCYGLYSVVRVARQKRLDLNNLETRPPRNYMDIAITGNNVSINIRPSYADNVLCVGPRYQPEDIEVLFPSYLGRKVSGVLGINEGQKLAESLKKFSSPKCYNVKGLLGQATTHFHIDDRVIAKAKYDKIRKPLIDKILAAYQAAAQKRMFLENQTDLRSQEAYELAAAGLLRPKDVKNPIIYSAKCTDFQPPNFTLEVNCLNEDEITLMELIHNLGISLRCYATCTGLQCVRHGCFTVKHALLKKHWKLEHIIDNMSLCLDTIEKNYPEHIKHSSFNFVNANT